MIFTFNTVMNGFISELEGGVLPLSINSRRYKIKKKKKDIGKKGTAESKACKIKKTSVV